MASERTTKTPDLRSTPGAGPPTAAAPAPYPVRLVVCLRTLAALDALDETLQKVAAVGDAPPASILLRTTDPRDILQFLDRPTYGRSGPPPLMRFDCVFLLDATLDAPGSGITLADHIREHSVDVPILFLTDHLEYVLIAFRAQPVDFLPRPVSPARLAECLRTLSQIQAIRRDEALLQRARGLETPRPAASAGHRRTGDTAPSDPTVQWADTTTPIALRCRGVTHQIAAGEILFVERCKTETTIHMASRRIDCTLPLSWFQDRLSPTGLFVRCHKSFLVNRRHILLIDVKSHMLTLSYGHRCDIGRTYRKSMSTFKDPHVVRSARPAAMAAAGRGGEG